MTGRASVSEAFEGPVTVYKVGGSLFDWPDLFPRLADLLRRSGGRPLLVSGGGAAADVVRDWDRVHGLGDEQAHRLAIKSLCLGEAFLAAGLGELPVVHDREGAAEAWRRGQIPVLCTDRFLAEEEAASDSTLPHRWSVTSDSIAAWVAERWPAGLVLLKSTSPDGAVDSFVDPYFQKAAERVLSKGWVDLRTGASGAFGPA